MKKIEKPRFHLNRGLVIVRYKQPYVDWVRAADPTPMEISLLQANDDGEAFLVPCYDAQYDPVDGANDAIQWVEKRWRMLFEYILESWILDESEWPQKRSLKMFREWFDVGYKSVVWDMGTEPLILEDWDDEGVDDENLH